MTAPELVAILRDSGPLPTAFSCEVPVDEAALLAASLSRRDYTVTWDSAEPGRTTTLTAEGRRISRAVDP